MSVINSMLRDLEQRRERGEVSGSDENGPLTEGVVATRPARRSPFGVLFKAMLIVLLGLLLWFVASSPLVQEGGFQLLQRLTSQPPGGDPGRSEQIAENGGGSSKAVVAQREPAPEVVEQKNPAPADSERAAPAPPAAEAPPVAAASEIAEPEPAAVEAGPAASAPAAAEKAPAAEGPETAAVESEPTTAEPEPAAIEADPAPPAATALVESRPVILLHDLVPIEIPVGQPEPPPPTRTAEEESVPPLQSERAALHKVEVSSTPDELAEQAYGEAVHALRGGERASAERMLRRSLEHQPQHIGSLEALSALMLSMGRYQEAESMVDRGLRQEAESGLLLQLKARLLMHGGKSERAVALLEQHLPAVGASPETHALLAALYQKQRRYRQAAERYQGLLRIDPSNGVWEMGYAIALESMGRRKEAYHHYERALKSGRLKSAALTFVEGKLREITAIGGQQ